MGETIVVVERKMTDDAYVFESIRGNDEETEMLIERAEPSNGAEALGSLVAIYCFDSSVIPDGNMFTCTGIGVPAGEFERAQLAEALSCQ